MSTTVAIVLVHFTDEAKHPLLANPMRVPVMDSKITVRDFAGQVLYRYFNMFHQRPTTASVKAMLVDNMAALFPVDRLLDVVNVPTETITFVLGNLEGEAATTSPKDIYKATGGGGVSPFLAVTPRSEAHQQQPAPPGYHDNPVAAEAPSSSSSTYHHHPTMAVVPPSASDSKAHTAGAKRQRNEQAVVGEDASPAPKPPASKKRGGGVTSMIESKLAATRREEPQYYQKAISASPAPSFIAPRRDNPTSAKKSVAAKAIPIKPTASTAGPKAKVAKPTPTVVAKKAPASVAAKKAPAPVAAKKAPVSANPLTPPTSQSTTTAGNGDGARSPDLQHMPTPERKAYYEADEEKKNWGTKAHLFFAPNYVSDIDKFIREERKKKRDAAAAKKAEQQPPAGNTTDPHKVANKDVVEAPPAAVKSPTTTASSPSNKVNRSLFSTNEEKSEVVAVQEVDRPKGWGPDAHSFFPSFYNADPRKAEVPPELLGQPIRARRRD